MEDATAERRNFEARSREFYENFIKAYGKEHVKILYAYLDVNEYYDAQVKELEKLESDKAKLEERIRKNPENAKAGTQLKNVNAQIEKQIAAKKRGGRVLFDI